MSIPAAELRFSMSSKARLTERDLGRFSADTLFERLARAVCRAGCLPRRLEQRGYRVWTQTIPAVITPKNRLLLGEPLCRSASD